MPDTPTPAESMMTAADGLASLIEIAEGHRCRLLALGWSETMAEMCAGNLLVALTTKAVNG